jgi:DNA-binding XRE family transcriptional regulator
MADKDAQYRVLAAVQKGTGRKNLKHGHGTIDKSGLPRRSEMIRQTKAEKESLKEESSRDHLIEDITSGEHKEKLKKTETVDKTQRTKEQLADLIKAEEESYKQAEQSDRAAVLADVAKGEQKLKKGKTVDKSKKRKKSLLKQIEDEKAAQAAEDAQQKLLTDLTKEQKLEKTETVDKSKISKTDLAAQIKAEKEALAIEGNQAKVLAAVATGGEKKKLKPTKTVDKSIANKSKEELGDLIKAEKETYKALEKEDRSKVLDDIVQGEAKLKKNKNQR